MSEKCLSGGVNDCENGDGDERKRGKNLQMQKVNTKAVKILSVLVIVMARGCEEGRV